METPHHWRRKEQKAGEQAFALPALEFGWGALGWRPYELHCAGLAAGGRTGSAVFGGLLQDERRPWDSETDHSDL